MTEESELARLVAEKNERAVDELYTMYAARLYSLCLRYSSDSEDAYDLLQDAFVKVLDKISAFTFRGKGSLYAWISRLTVNLAISRLRIRRLSFISLNSASFEKVDDVMEDDVAGIPESALIDMISHLPDMRRAVFNMFCIDGYSHKEIAKTLRISEKGSASILSRAKAQLRYEVREYIRNHE